MSSLILHLHGPMQSWGFDAHSDDRPSERFPTKSALVGLLAGALGRSRGSDVVDLAQLEVVVRVDRAGEVMRDYHTIGAGYGSGKRIPLADGNPGRATAVVSKRYYLSDAAFTVAISGDLSLVNALDEAVRNPRWALALGRRSCPPAEPFALGMTDEEPITYLRDVLPVVRRHGVSGNSVLFVADDPAGVALTIRDVPTAALNELGTYGVRRVRRWTEVMDEARFVSDPLMLVAEEVEVDG
jgi:CRISPR system Cascade subunit CasD